ncbi:hypothetical protein [Paenibacillus chitinolyticus]|uniref:hypothetical protein n=1 Tax=Paenibacillus chitinolyticus TaxID=79263 RepID=UPI001C44DEC5|nr:hypothetical protein [Paenibacillus chitinolyticus]MBV6717252.1 hypothetical protein [Paenibacillus chitinolyticus]
MTTKDTSVKEKESYERLKYYQDKSKRLMLCISEIANSGMNANEMREYARNQVEIENIEAKRLNEHNER